MTIDAGRPESIRAYVHPDAISRVTRFFNATALDTLNELFQNARRANATRIDVTIDDGRITVTDDGDGIADPAALLAFGHSEWNAPTAQHEDPAGMGLYSLSHCDVTIRSRPRDGSPAWQVSLSTDHFLGNREASVEPLPADAMSPGASITFTSDTLGKYVVENAARYLLLPVTCNGESVPRYDFLAQAAYVTEWQGLRIGVFSDQRSAYSSDLNFHGIQPKGPVFQTVSSIHRQWHVRVDVIDCPRLQLTLPARREVVHNEFLKELQDVCRAVIYRAMLEQQEPVAVPFKVHQDAASLGINLPVPEPCLRPWIPPTEHYSADTRRKELNLPQTVDTETAIVVDTTSMATCDQHAFYQAARQQGISHQLWEPDVRFEGYDWYNRLSRSYDLEITFVNNGQAGNIADLRQLEPRYVNTLRPDSLTFTLRHEKNPDEESHALQVPGKVAFITTEEDYWLDPDLLVTRDCDLDVHSLTELMVDAYFIPSDDQEADSEYTQLQECRDGFYAVAVSVLKSPKEAIISAVEQAVSRHVLHHIPSNHDVLIHIRPGTAIEVELARSPITTE